MPVDSYHLHVLVHLIRFWKIFLDFRDVAHIVLIILFGRESLYEKLCNKILLQHIFFTLHASIVLLCLCITVHSHNLRPCARYRCLSMIVL